MVNAFLHNALYLLRFSTEKARNKFSFTSQELVSHLTGEMKTICPIRSHWQSFAFQIVRKIIIKNPLSELFVKSNYLQKDEREKICFSLDFCGGLSGKHGGKKTQKREQSKIENF